VFFRPTPSSLRTGVIKGLDDKTEAKLVTMNPAMVMGGVALTIIVGGATAKSIRNK